MAIGARHEPSPISRFLAVATVAGGEPLGSCHERFDPAAERLVEVARVLDRIYGG